MDVTDQRVASEAQRRVLEDVLRHGPSSSGQIGKRLGMTSVAARQHAVALEEHGLLQGETEARETRGRPSVIWSLTDAARTPGGAFPDAHAELAVGVLRAVRESFGDKGIRRIVEVRSRDQKNLYRDRLPGSSAPLKKRVEALAAQRTAEGYMAEVERESAQSYLLIENHCPVCDAAKECQGLCAGELEVFRSVLGDDVEVERIEHLLSEGRRCVYRVRRRR